MNKGQRSFSIIYLKSKSKGQKSKEGGRYISKTPQRAAIKAFNQECRKSKIKGQCSLIIVLRETTSGSKHKLYRYRMKRIKLSKPMKIKRGDVEIIVKYKTTALKLKSSEPKRIMKKILMKGGGNGMDVDMNNNEDEGIYTGYYNIIGHDAILHTDYFLIPHEEEERKIIKKIIKKHKKEFKKAGVENMSIEIFDTMFYPREEGPKAIRDALEYQLPLIRSSMEKMSKRDVKQRKRDAFDMSDISSALDML
jgi:hypothetical protein